MKTTIKDVAKKANVSVATVSRVINKLPGYTQKTEKKVLQTISELGYYPNELARSLVGKRIDTIGVLMPDLSSMVASEILEGIEDAAHKNNHSIIICNTDRNGIRTIKYLNILRNKQIDGVLIVSEKLKKKYVDMINDMNMQVVLISTCYNKNLTYIKVDDEKAAYDATCYLINNGHTNIGMLAGTKDDDIAGIPRVNGFLKAISDNNLIFNKNNLIYGDFSFDSGKECFMKLIKRSSDITAIFCASDEMAVGSISSAFDMGIKIPDQVSLIGYDNTKLSLMVNPSLTTISQSLYEMGYQGLNMLIDKINGLNVKSNIIQHKIIERKTVKNIKKVKRYFLRSKK
jgi:LacI family transcriptional regulator